MSKELKFYQIRPIDDTSPSQVWQVDTDGLEYIKYHYSNYGDTKIDRWHEFKSVAITEIHIDFGGSMIKDTPLIKNDVCGANFSFFVSHSEMLHVALKSIKPKKGVYRINGRWQNLAIGEDVYNSLLNVMDKDIDKWNKIYDDFFNEWKSKHPILESK